MRVLTNKELYICLENFRELIEQWADIESLFIALDSILIEYARYKLNDSDFVGQKEGKEDFIFYYTNKLREVFTKEKSHENTSK